jgi:cation:H+ antiporter
MAMGNVVGSNTMNAMLIVGCAAIVAPMTISRNTVKKDIPFSVAASVLLILIAFDSFLSRLDGILLLIGFAAFLYYGIKTAKSSQSTTVVANSPLSMLRSTLYLLLGLTLLIVGSNVFVDSASRVAYSLGISEGVVGLTIVAGGTSLPELATSVVAARKGQSAIAIGNVIGSNVFNILLILGTTAVISPMQIQGITIVDMSMMLGSVALVWLFSYTRYTVERWEGALLLGAYLVYLGWLLSNV